MHRSLAVCRRQGWCPRSYNGLRVRLFHIKAGHGWTGGAGAGVALLEFCQNGGVVGGVCFDLKRGTQGRHDFGRLVDNLEADL